MLVSQRLIKDNVHQEHATMQLIIFLFCFSFFRCWSWSQQTCDLYVFWWNVVMFAASCSSSLWLPWYCSLSCKLSIDPFGVLLHLFFKVWVQKACYDILVNSISSMNENWYSWQRLWTQTRFEVEAEVYSEMASSVPNLFRKYWSCGKCGST